MSGGKDNNIEINIADEAPSGNERVMKRHSSQPPTTLLQNLIPRQKVGCNVMLSTNIKVL